MRFILAFSTVFLLFSCGGEDEAIIGEFTTMEVDKEYDAGTVAKGQLVKTEIKIKNTGSYPLVIADVKGACSCTVSSFEQDPISPGETTIVKAEIDTDSTGKGIISKTVSITANTRPSTTTVTIKAKVID